jgi:hypothetical protein
MGSALPNGNDIDAINQLNNQFTGANFDAIRKYVASSGDDFLWGGNKRLARAAYRLNIWPTAGTKPRKRWFAFLGRILSKNNQDDIKDALKKAVQNDTGNVIGVHFWAQYDPNVAPNSYVVVVTDEPADAIHIFRRITLLTDHEIPVNEGGDPDPGKDPGETGPVHPISNKKPKPKKKAKKAKKKKTAKKKATKRARKSYRK